MTALLINPVSATPENAELSGKVCSFCHPNEPPALGEAGEYFMEKRTLDGFKGAEETETAAPEETVDDIEEDEVAEHSEIGIHIPQWDVAIICFLSLLLVMGIVYISGI